MSHPFANLPLDRAQPDAQRFIDVMLGRRATERPPMIEYLVDATLLQPIVKEILGRPWVDATPSDRASVERYLDNQIAVWRGLGYDIVRYEESLPFVETDIVGEDTTASRGTRTWRDQHHGTIASWADFEAYPWPQVTDATLANYAYLNDHLPEGMGLICCHGGGPYEHLAGIFSYEGLCLALYDQPDLVEAVAQRIGELMYSVYRQLVELDRVVAIFPGDDMGFRTSTLLPPDALRRYTLLWHKRYAELAHERGLPYFLHSCGNIVGIMEDLIEDVGIDAKHSYENAIMPVDEFQTRYGDRIGVLGGIDVDILSRYPADVVRHEVRRVIDICHPRGRFAVGSGNSIPSYVPLESYLTMLDEAQR